MEALPAITEASTVRVMGKYGVLSRRELESREEIYLERYVKDIAVEARLTLEVAKTDVLPAAMAYQKQLAETALALQQLGKEHCTVILDEVNGYVAALQKEAAGLAKALAHEAKGSTLKHAKHARDVLVPAMNKVRDVVDLLEGVVADELWPLPTYQEMLFIK